MLVRLFFSSKNLPSDIARLLLFSLFPAILCYLAAGPVGISGDTLSYIRLSEDILALQPTEQFFRSPGYPFFLILTGFISHGLVWPMLVVQFAIALAVPVLIYLTLRPLAPQSGFNAALLMIVSLIPFLDVKVMLTEQLGICFNALILFLLATFIRKKNPSALYGAAFVLLLQGLVRPVTALFWIPWMAAAFLAHRQSWRHIVLAIAIILGTNAVWTGFRNHVLVPGGEGNINQVGHLLFHNIYLSGDIGRNGPPVLTQNGPASAELISMMQAYVRQNLPEILRREKELHPDRYRIGLFDVFKGRPDDLARNMFDKPNLAYYWLMWEEADRVKGPNGGDLLFLNAVIESFRADPLATIRYIFRNVRCILLGTPHTYKYDTSTPPGLHDEPPPYPVMGTAYVKPVGDWIGDWGAVPSVIDQLTPDQQSGLRSPKLAAIPQSPAIALKVTAWLNLIMPILVPGSLVLALMAAWLHFRQRSIWLPMLLFCMAAVMLNTLVTALFAVSLPRLILPNLPYLLVALSAARWRVRILSWLEPKPSSPPTVAQF